MTTSRLPVSLVAALAVVAMIAMGAVLVGRSLLAPALEAPPEAGPTVGAPDPRVAEAVAVLRRWDEQRAAAYARGDRDALRRLYVPRSWAGTADLRLLRSYAERGLVVRGMATQLLSVEPVDVAGDRLVLRVRDRLSGAVAVGGPTRVVLPSDAPTTRRVTLQRRGTRWLVSGVSRR
jgi:hypothetical protein